MPKYDISPLGVQQVLQKVQTDAGTFDTILTPLNGWLESLATATAGSGAILPAVQALFELKGKDLQSMGNHITSSVQGAVNAVTAYNEGDLEMITAYQTQAAEHAVNPPAPLYVNPGLR
jgi:hypothetical protein